jgi:signal transduction histidine kinase
MNVPSDSIDLKNITGAAARKLLELREEILAAWGEEARREVQTAKLLDRPILFNAVPPFIDNLIEALSLEHPRDLATTGTSAAKEHGGERARLTRYGPEQLIHEYQILRDIILNKLSTSGCLTEKDQHVIQKSFDQAIQESMVAFFLVHSKIREQFVASLGHDLRNPLGAAKMSAELICRVVEDIRDEELREDIKGLAQRVVNNTRRADRMIQDLLDASVVQVGEKLPLKISECDILSIVRDVVVDLPITEQRRVHINGGAVRGCWDGNALRRAIENVVSNAFKYGTLSTPISIRIATINERMILSVHNEGKHIPIEEQETLFQPFRRSQAAKESGKRGWGIGLALVRGVAEGHGGSVVIDSLPGSGTTFLIDIPVDARPYLYAERTEPLISKNHELEL